MASARGNALFSAADHAVFSRSQSFSDLWDQG